MLTPFDAEALAMIEAKTLLLTAHVAALVLGLGTAVFLDLHLLRALRSGRALRPQDAALLEPGEALVTAGLAVLWASGAALVWLAWSADPATLDNPKLLAKITIVFVLTGNGILLRTRVLPQLRAGVGAPLFARMSVVETRVALTAGAVSATGWGAAFVLGMVRELNGQGSVALYVASWGVVALAAALGAGMLVRSGASGQGLPVSRQLLPHR